MGIFSLFKWGSSVPDAVEEKSITIDQLASYVQGGSTSAGITVNSNLAMNCSTVYACVRVLSESVAQLPLIFYERKGNGKDRAIEHPLYKVLHRSPNSWMTAFEFWRNLITHLCLRGNAYCLILRDRNKRVYELIPMHPDTIEVKQRADLSLEYVRKVQGSTKVFQQSEVFHLRAISSDGVTGVSPITQQRQAIGLAMAAERFGAELFGNGAKPGGVITHPGKLTVEGAINLRKRFEDATSGENRHRTVVLDEGMGWTQVSMSAEDSQFLETRKFQRSEIAGIFRVPPHMVADLSDATFSNVEHMGLEFVKHSLMPWLVQIEQTIFRDLLTPQEQETYFAEFLVDGLLRGDLKSRYESYQIAIMNGVMSADDVRALENLPPRPDGKGDTYYYPANLLPAGTVLQQQPDKGAV